MVALVANVSKTANTNRMGKVKVSYPPVRNNVTYSAAFVNPDWSCGTS